MRSNESLAEHRLEQLISRLPRRIAAAVRWLRLPDVIWLRVPLGILFLFGSVLAILPGFGIWMLPLGLVLLAQDIPPLRRALYALVNWTAARRPKWFGEQPA